MRAESEEKTGHIVGDKVRFFTKGVFDEVFTRNQYGWFVDVEPGDLVLDLGCSEGVFYFKHRDKGIKYIGIDSDKGRYDEFFANLHRTENQPEIYNYKLVEFPLAKNEVTFSSIVHLLTPRCGKKIDFLKFDIEEFEKLIFQNEYDLFKEKVRKFSGEFHLWDQEWSTDQLYDTLEKMRDDEGIDLKIYSVDGKNVTDLFFTDRLRGYYTEVIVSGKVKG